MSDSRKTMPLRARLLGLAAASGIVVVLIGIPGALVAIGALPSSSTWA